MSPAMQCQTIPSSDPLNTTLSIHNALFWFCIPLLTFALTEVICLILSIFMKSFVD